MTAQQFRKSADSFTKAYVEAALWSSLDDNDKPLLNNYSIEDIAPETLAKMVADCKAFQEANSDHIADENLVYQSETTADERAGHDFWLTRNGHGAGFWDGDWDESVSKILDDAAHAFGEVNLYTVTKDDETLIYA